MPAYIAWNLLGILGKFQPKLSFPIITQDDMLYNVLNFIKKSKRLLKLGRRRRSSGGFQAAVVNY